MASSFGGLGGAVVGVVGLGLHAWVAHEAPEIPFHAAAAAGAERIEARVQHGGEVAVEEEGGEQDPDLAMPSRI